MLRIELKPAAIWDSTTVPETLPTRPAIVKVLCSELQHPGAGHFGNLLEIQILGPHSRAANKQTTNHITYRLIMENLEAEEIGQHWKGQCGSPILKDN